MQAAAWRNKLESGRTDVLSPAMCEPREAPLVFVMVVPPITFQSNKFVREIHLLERSEMPRSLRIVEHQVNLGTARRSGKLEIRGKKKGGGEGVGQDFCCFCKSSGVNDAVPVEFLTYLKPNLPLCYVCFSAYFLEHRNSQSCSQKGLVFLFLMVTHR